MPKPYQRIARLRTPEAFRAYTKELGINLPFDETLQSGPNSPLGRPYQLASGRTIGNHFCVQPMEGWDGHRNGQPSELTLRRWHNFGRSGAKLIWGGEAVAVRHDGRANPNQLLICLDNLPGLNKIRQSLIDNHREYYGETNDLLIGLQLTHSGRFSRPNHKAQMEPKILYHHPLLDELYQVEPAYPVLSDMEIDDLIGDFVKAAQMAAEIGFDFVDIKHCHGYLGHEFLSAYNRPGRYGGNLANRTRFLRQIVAGIRAEAPSLMVAVRLSVFDMPPFRPGPDGVGQPLTLNEENKDYPYAFGGDPTYPEQQKLDEPIAILELFGELGIELVNLTGGNPYANPHLTRPAYFPPSDGYLPPEDPLVGVARQINVTATLKKRFPNLAITGSAYSYLQEWLPHVAQNVVRNGMADFIGLGRMTLSYPEFAGDILAGKPLQRKRICRTFSDCTSAPRNGLVSGCYPLDNFYKSRPEARKLKDLTS
jgi:2,4-dienoyl-CoA reductase-like NADH-dependent reductase (Old Yellow Enzyme family)